MSENKARCHKTVGEANVLLIDTELVVVELDVPFSFKNFLLFNRPRVDG